MEIIARTSESLWGTRVSKGTAVMGRKILQRGWRQLCLGLLLVLGSPGSAPARGYIWNSEGCKARGRLYPQPTPWAG